MAVAIAVSYPGIVAPFSGEKDKMLAYMLVYACKYDLQTQLRRVMRAMRRKPRLGRSAAPWLRLVLVKVAPLGIRGKHQTSSG